MSQNVANIDFDRLIDDCASIENTISSLIKDNARKECELSCLQAQIIGDTQTELDRLVDYEHLLRTNLEAEREKKFRFDSDIKRCSDVNEKLSKLVSNVQKSNNERSEIDREYEVVNQRIFNSIQEYEQIKNDYKRLTHDIELLNNRDDRDNQVVKALLSESKNLVVSLQKKDNILRVLEHQNIFAGQQFDHILDQIPWEPLSHQQIEELRKSNHEQIRNLAEDLQLQAHDIAELRESLSSRKKLKLDILEKLATQLDQFVKKREEAIVMSGFNNC